MGNPFVRQTDLIIGFAAVTFPVQYTTFVELWLKEMDDFCKKKHILAHILGILCGGGLVLTPNSSLHVHAITVEIEKLEIEAILH